MAPTRPVNTVIELLNVNQDEDYPHQLIYIAGQITCARAYDTNSVHVTVNKSDHSIWQVVNGRFKCFVLLSLGDNNIEFCCDNDQNAVKNIRCYFKPRETATTVKFVYIKCRDSAGEFQALDNSENSLETALQLLKFNSLLCQLFFAECFVAAGFPRRTFSLAPLEVLDTELTESKSLTDEFLEENNKIFWYFYRELEKKGLMGRGVKVVGVLGCTRLDQMLSLSLLESQRRA